MKKFFSWVFLIFSLMTLVVLPVTAEITEAVSGTRTIDLTGIVVPALALMFNVILCAACGLVLPKLKKWLDAKASTEQRKLLWEMTVHLVEAAEQVIGRGLGNQKLRYVKSALEDAGFTVDANLIEAAVREMNQNSLETFKDVLVPDEEQDEDEKESEEETLEQDED